MSDQGPEHARRLQQHYGTLERNRTLRRRVEAGEPSARVARELGMSKQRADQVLRSTYGGKV